MTRLRESAGLTQTQLGDRIGRHWTTIQRWESGVSGLYDAARKALNEALPGVIL